MSLFDHSLVFATGNIWLWLVDFISSIRVLYKHDTMLSQCYGTTRWHCQTISPELGCYAFETRVSANGYRNPSPHPKWKGKSLRVCVCACVRVQVKKNSKRGLLTKAARRLVQFPFLQQLKHEVLLYVFFFFQYDSESYCCPNIYLQFLSFNQPCFERSFSHKTREEKTDNQFHSEPLRATNLEPSKGLTDKVKEIQKLEMIEICFLP